MIKSRAALPCFPFNNDSVTNPLFIFLHNLSWQPSSVGTKKLTVFNTPSTFKYGVQKRSSMQMVLKDPTEKAMDAMPSGMGGGGYTDSNAESRRVVPEDVRGRPVMKIVYVVLENQYQSSMTAAVKRINAGSDSMAVECVGYLLEELRNEDAFQKFKEDVAPANFFIRSLFFVPSFAEKVVSGC